MKRPFRGLRERQPRERYDAVIIGAGIGGLFCANLLAKAGLSVLMVEQHYMVGGYCSTFKRRGYVFDASTHFYPLLGNPTTMTGKLLVDLGLTTRWRKMDPVDTFHFPDGSRFDVPADLDVYLRRLKEEFPHESANIDRFFGAVGEAYDHGLLYYFRGRDTGRLGSYLEMTVRDALDTYFEDRKLKLLLTADCPHWGSPPKRTSFVFDSMLRLSYFHGNYYPVNGSQAFADELAQRFEEQSGEILMSAHVDRILVEDGRVRGVEMETLRGARKGDRHRVEAEVVVSNADLLATLERGLPAGSVDPDYLAAVRGLRTSMPCYLTHVGLRDVSAETLDRVQGYYWRSWDPDDVGSGGMHCKIFVPTLYEPRMAPPGGQVAILQRVMEVDYDAVEDWPAHKADVERTAMAHLESVVPGISDNVVVHLCASAQTAKRFTLNRDGAMLGWEMSPDQLGDHRPSIRGPARNLYLTGHWTQPGGGITPVIVSAMQTAEAVIRGEKARHGLGFVAGDMPPATVAEVTG